MRLAKIAGLSKRGKQSHVTSPVGPMTAPRSPSATIAYCRRTAGAGGSRGPRPSPEERLTRWRGALPRASADSPAPSSTVAPPRVSGHGGSGECRSGAPQHRGVLGQPQLDAARVAPVAEDAPGPMVEARGAVEGGPQVAGPVGVDGFVGLLRAVTGACQIAIEQPRSELLGHHRCH